MDRIAVIVPVASSEFAGPMLDSLAGNTIRPSVVFVIDNTEEGFSWQGNLNVEIRRASKKLGVNSSWEFGKQLALGHKVDFISVLNDDLLLKPNFFSEILLLFDIYRCGVAIPHTIFDKNEFLKWHEDPSWSIFRVRKYEGWAWTIRASLYAKIPPIPPQLEIFYGDAWIWYHTLRLGYFWYKTSNTVVWHRVGASVSKHGVKVMRAKRKKEKYLFLSLLGGQQSP